MVSKNGIVTTVCDDGVNAHSAVTATSIGTAQGIADFIMLRIVTKRFVSSLIQVFFLLSQVLALTVILHLKKECG
jgi:hypothetical protein